MNLSAPVSQHAGTSQAPATCPKCGLVTKIDPVRIPQWRLTRSEKITHTLLPFIKRPTMNGHVCSYCHHTFYISQCLPHHRIYRLWLLLLAGMAAAVAVILYLIVFGS